MIRTTRTRTTRRSPGGAPERAAALTLLLAVALAACGNLTAGGLAETTVVLSGDAADDDPQPAVQTDLLPQGAGPAGRSVLLPGAAAPTNQQGEGSDAPNLAASAGPAGITHDDGPEGEVEVELSVFLVAEDGDLVPITAGDVRVRVDLEGVEEPEIGSRAITPRTYTGLRMVFTEIEAEVDAGLIIGGELVLGAIDVEIEDPLPVTKPLSLTIAEGEAVELLVDLNAESWLLAVDPITKLVDAQTFADRVSVRVR